MPHTAVIVQLYLHMVFSEPFLQVEGIREKNLIFAHLNIGRGKPGEIRKQGRDQRIMQLLPLRVVPDSLVYIFL